MLLVLYFISTQKKKFNQFRYRKWKYLCENLISTQTKIQSDVHLNAEEENKKIYEEKKSKRKLRVSQCHNTFAINLEKNNIIKETI